MTAPGVAPEAEGPHVCGEATGETEVHACQLGAYVGLEALTKIQLDEPVSRVRGWELGIKEAISQGWILERQGFCGLATGGTGGPSQ